MTRKRARSEGSLPIKSTLTAEQDKAVKKATEGMTIEQRKQVQIRQEKIRPRRDNSVSSRDEGPSNLNNKGKTIDPREWGNVDFDREELDIDAQAAALESFKDQNDAQDPSSGRKSRQKKSRSKDNSRRHTKKSTDKRKHPRRHAETQPSAQIAPKSYLGAALKTIDRSQRSRRDRSPSTGSSSSSSRSSSPSSPSEDGSQSSSSPDDSEESEHRYHGKRRRDNRHGRNGRRRRRSSSSSSSRNHIKPIPPTKYDGDADVRKYH